jgi:endonuclease YncB( thermonuclease family)
VTGCVVRVVDGDTIHALIGTRVEKVRDIGVHALEIPHEARAPGRGLWSGR